MPAKSALTTKIYNLKYLTGFANGNKNFVKEMIEIFVTEVPGDLLKFEERIKKEDYKAIKQIAHNMKSTIPYFGLEKLIEKEVNEIEMLAAGKKEIKKIKTLYLKIKKVCEQAASELREIEK